MLQFDTAFQHRFPFPVEPVPVVDRDDMAAGMARHRESLTPAIVHGGAAWPALSSWQDPDHLLRRVAPDSAIFCRQAIDPNAKYRERYEETTWEALVQALLADGPAVGYLTQGLVFRARGFGRRIERSRYPALLHDLAQDCDLPNFMPDDALLEGILWFGRGGQVTPLHFDEPENVSGTIMGRKRWFLFPPSEAKGLLLPGKRSFGTVMSSLEALTRDGEWRGGDVSHGYQVETGPGDLLYLPPGYLHQVYSSPEINAAVNFWYLDMRRLGMVRRALVARARRRTGFHKPFKTVAWSLLIAARLIPSWLAFLGGKGVERESELVVGPTAYDSAKD